MCNGAACLFSAWSCQQARRVSSNSRSSISRPARPTHRSTRSKQRIRSAPRSLTLWRMGESNSLDAKAVESSVGLAPKWRQMSRSSELPASEAGVGQKLKECLPSPPFRADCLGRLSGGTFLLPPVAPDFGGTVIHRHLHGSGSNRQVDVFIVFSF